MMASLSIGIWNWIGVYLRSCLSSKMPKQGFSCIGLEIGLGHILCVISFLDIDMMTNLSIGIWNWIGVYVRPCLSSKVPKQGCPCIGLKIGLGHFLYVVSWIDNIFLPKNVQSGKSVYLIWNWIGFPLDDWI